MTNNQPANSAASFSSCSGSRAAALFLMQSFPRYLRNCATAAALLFIAAALAGCSHNNYLNDNDELRRQNLDLRQKVEQLQKSNDLRVAQVHTLEHQLTATTQPGMEGADVPRAVSLRFERYSGLVNEKGSTIVRLYVSALDQEGRFIPAAGRAEIQAVAIEAGHPPALIAEKNYPPPAWDAAYRTGLTGTHYTIELPLPATLTKATTEITVKLTFTDAGTGAVLTESKTLRVSR